MEIETLRDKIRAGEYLVKSHAIQHALKEGFDRKHMTEAILNGAIIEEYHDDKRVLICGSSTLIEDVTTKMHIICEYSDPVYIEFVTAYIPDEVQWERPDFIRRRRFRR